MIICSPLSVYPLDLEFIYSDIIQSPEPVPYYRTSGRWPPNRLDPGEAQIDTAKAGYPSISEIRTLGTRAADYCTVSVDRLFPYLSN